MPQCDFNKVAEITLWHGCSPVDLPQIFRTYFLKNTSGGDASVWMVLIQNYWNITPPDLCEISLTANVATDEGNGWNEMWTLNNEMK